MSTITQFRIVCTNCWKATKYDILDIVTGLPCDKCGAKL
jgi:DNA-directed RNA polymerase subunit RPC12/RpoP